jgi:hypothetical protein
MSTPRAQGAAGAILFCALCSPAYFYYRATVIADATHEVLFLLHYFYHLIIKIYDAYIGLIYKLTVHDKNIIYEI